MIFYCAELDEVLLYAGGYDPGITKHHVWVTPDDVTAPLNYDLDHDWVLVGYL